MSYWEIRDLLFPPQEKAILFVAHPDDDTLFFHTFIKEYKPYVVLCSGGWSLRRLPCFFKAMRRYGVKYRAYDLDNNEKRERLLRKRVKKMLSIGRFELCATHNAEGEYGHEMHQRVHRVVMTEAQIPVRVPVKADRIVKFPVDNKTLEEKQNMFKHIYTTEIWVLEQYSFWVSYEQLEPVEL